MPTQDVALALRRVPQIFLDKHTHIYIYPCAGISISMVLISMELASLAQNTGKQAFYHSMFINI